MNSFFSKGVNSGEVKIFPDRQHIKEFRGPLNQSSKEF